MGIPNSSLRPIPCKSMADQRTFLIDSLAHKGDGLAHDGDQPVYLPYVLPGERVVASQDAKGQWHVDDILEASPARVAPVCRHFGKCGGCALQHLRTEDYLAWKQRALETTLHQRGFDRVELASIVQIPPASRRRLTLTARKHKSGVALGFQKSRSHDIEDLSECPVALPIFAQTFPVLRDMLGESLSRKGQARLVMNATDIGLDVAVSTQKSAPLKPQTVAQLAEKCAANKLARLTWDEDLIYQSQAPTLKVDGLSVSPPPGAFLQASEQAQNTLIDFVVQAASGAKKVVDLFCGVGTFALPLSNASQVSAFDAAGSMIEALRQAADQAGIGNRLVAERRDLYRRPLQSAEFKPFNVAVLDPPRNGALEQSKQMAASKLEKIIYVSCNPATFARDARELVNGGFNLKRVVPIDQFLWSPHSELVALLER